MRNPNASTLLLDEMSRERYKNGGTLTMSKAISNRDGVHVLLTRISIWAFACTLGCVTAYVPVDPEAGPNGQSMSPELDQGVSSDATNSGGSNPTDLGGSNPTNPEVCAPPSEAVSILPRSSNHEIWRLYSDLAMVPIDPTLFAQWTPLAQVRGFDHMTESRIDGQTLEEQLRTTESVAEILVNTPEVMAPCPTPPAQRPVCTLHPVYDAQAQFSQQQDVDCWRYLDSDGVPLSFDAGAQRWMSHTDPGLFIWRTGLHPGISVDVMRRWTAPVDGQVTLRGSISDADPGGGDGVVSEIRTNDGTIFQGREKQDKEASHGILAC